MSVGSTGAGASLLAAAGEATFSLSPQADKARLKGIIIATSGANFEVVKCFFKI
jgi:hypothetical protein